ncbi:DMT family transporter [uncultured Flavonifractor sp.]|uniref:DMT family transporter n=1 Tax=uncultured Flavonifractor sp. TaxID=1193534 RepID=UPI0026359D70|nr:EamA family transporter [uncultured Flavonifractor sp.]
MKNQLALGHMLALAVSVVWGTTYISTKVLLTAFHPVEILIFRFLLAWAVLFLCSPRPLLPKHLKEELPFLCCGLTGLTFYSMLENYALQFSLASTVGLIISSSPMFTALLLWVCRRARRPGSAFFAGFVLAMAGIALISLAEGESFDCDPIGILLSLGSAVCWGGYGVCLEWAHSSSGLSDLQITRKIFFWGLLFTLPFVWGNGLSLELSRFADPVQLGNTVYLGIGASALCFLAWNRASVLIGPIATNVYLYLMPVITVVASVLILQEPVSLLTLAAIVLILTGLMLSQRKSRPRT